MLYNLLMFLGLSLIIISLKVNHLFKPLIIVGLFNVFFSSLLDPVGDGSSTFALGNASAQALLYTVIVLSAPRSLLRFFPIICLLNSLVMIFTPWHYGLGLATSVDAMLIAILYPLYIRYLYKFSSLYLKLPLLLIPIIAIFISKGSVGIGGLTLGLIILYSRPKFYLYLLIPISLFITYYLYDPQLFNSSYRFEAWTWTIQWWSQLPMRNHLFGTGLGTFSILGPYLQIVTNSGTEGLFIELHNDWLQILFELGYVGISLAFSTFLYLVYRARHYRYLLSSILVYGACAFFYYPLHNVVTAIYGVILFKVILDLDNYSPNNLYYQTVTHDYDDIV
jgi:hypothetical protein